ncbi:MAG: hypothetical protein AB7E61_07090 [Acholeplasmataceae bacterium]
MGFKKSGIDNEPIIGFDLFDYDATQDQLSMRSEIEKELKVTDDEIFVRDKALSYLLEFNLGRKTKNCPMSELDLVVNGNGDGRLARRAAELIAKTTEYTIGNQNGYYICSTIEEIEHANDQLKARVKSSILRIISNGLTDVNELHVWINECKKKFPKIAEGQLNIKLEKHSYIKK